MTDFPQAEADALLAMRKRRQNAIVYRLPGHRGKLTVPLEALSGRETFTLDVARGGISLEKRTYQHRARHSLILARLDFGTPHRNPNDSEVGVPHLHLYREGFQDKWAFPVPSDRFPDTNDPWETLADFMRFCNIVEPPEFDRELFV